LNHQLEEMSEMTTLNDLFNDIKEEFSDFEGSAPKREEKKSSFIEQWYGSSIGASVERDYKSGNVKHVKA